MADLDIGEHFGALLDIAHSSGLFDSVTGYEPKSAPATGMSVSVWGSSVSTVPQVSGLGAVSVRAELQLRIHKGMLSEPQESIDLDVINAAGQLMGALAGGYTLGGIAHAVDLLGAYGEALRAEAGYLTIGNTLFRVMDVFVPIILNDVWTVNS